MIKNRHNILFAIGIDNYKSSLWDNLNNAVFDVQTISNILKERYEFELYPEPLYNKEATKENIYRSFNELKQFAGPEDNIIIIFAGHGQMHQQTQRGYWVPYEATISIETFIENSVIKDFIEDINAKHIWLISDSCFSGTFLSKTRGIVTEKKYAELDQLNSRWMLASGREEKVSDGQPGEHSPFSKYLIRYLLTNDNLYTSVREIIRYVSFVTAKKSKQAPTGSSIENINHSGGEMILILNDNYVQTAIEETKGTTHNKALKLEQLQNQKREDALAAGKEVLLVKSQSEASTYLILENFRFDDEGNKKITFENDTCSLCLVAGFDLIQRFATMSGCTRFIEDNSVVEKGARVVIWPANKDDDAEESPFAILQAEFMEELLNFNKHIMTCLHCDKKLISNNSSMVEIDEINFPENVGNVHNKCVRPTDRIIGKAGFKDPFESKFLDFDIHKWAELLEKGQGQLNGQHKHLKPNTIAVIAWNSKNLINEGSYCIKSVYADGSSSYVKKGKDIHRFKEDEIDIEVQRFNQMKLDEEQKGNPMGKIVGTGLNGVEDFLLQNNKSNPTITKIVRFEKAKYSKQFDLDSKRFDNDYAPLGLVQHSESEETVIIDNVVPLISDPLHFNSFYENWNAIGANMKKCSLKIIASDLELDYYLRIFSSDDLVPIINPMFSIEPRELISGYPIHDINEILNAGREKIIWQQGDKVRLMLMTIEGKECETGILLSDEFVDDKGQECVFFQPYKNGVAVPDLKFKVPTAILEIWEEN